MRIRTVACSVAAAALTVTACGSNSGPMAAKTKDDAVGHLAEVHREAPSLNGSHEHLLGTAHIICHGREYRCFRL